MKSRLLLVTGLAFLSFYTHAQTTSGNRLFGIRAGINFQNLNGKDFNGNTLSNDLVLRYHVGANVEIPLAPDFYFQPGLLFITKGAKSSTTILGTTVTSTVNISYLELPLNLLYKPLLGTGHLLLGFGPYLAYGIGGKVTLNDQSESIKFANTANATDFGTTYKPFDAGGNLLAGYEFSNRISFQLNAQLGMIKINPDYSGIPDSKLAVKNTGFGLSLGYRF